MATRENLKNIIKKKYPLDKKAAPFKFPCILNSLFLFLIYFCLFFLLSWQNWSDPIFFMWKSLTMRDNLGHLGIYKYYRYIDIFFSLYRYFFLRYIRISILKFDHIFTLYAKERRADWIHPVFILLFMFRNIREKKISITIFLLYFDIQHNTRTEDHRKSVPVPTCLYF